jgi:hypothetical protein
MSKGEKRAALRVILVLLGVLVGWVAAGYAFMYFIGNGVPSDFATEYSIIVFLAFFGAFGLAAFKVKSVRARDYT